jgi:hypothetical protein
MYLSKKFQKMNVLVCACFLIPKVQSLAALGRDLGGSLATDLIGSVGNDPLTAAIGPDGISSMANIGKLAPQSFVPNPSKLVALGLRGMTNLPPSDIEPLEIIDPNLMSEVRIYIGSHLYCRKMHASVTIMRNALWVSFLSVRFSVTVTDAVQT